MSRPVDPESGYRIKIHKNKGHSYASTQPAVLDPDTGKKKYHRIHWGTVDKNNKFYPGSRYLLASASERAKLIFPNDWDLSETKDLPEISQPAEPASPVIESQDENRLYGDVWLLEQIADVTGIRQDLMAVFDNDSDKVNAILTLAYFPMSGKGSYSHLEAWQRIAKTPYDEPLNSVFITRLTQNITEQDRMSLLKLRAKRLHKEEMCAVDSTSRSAYGDKLADIHKGKNKEHLPLEQTLEVVVYTLSSHMPVYYRTFPGNVPDSRTLNTILLDLDQAGFNDIVLITDRGYETVRNLETYIDRGQRMIMAAKVGQQRILEKIRGFKQFNGRPDDMEIEPQERFYYKQYDIEYQVEGPDSSVKKSDRLKLNLYFDPHQRDNENMEIDIALKSQKDALEEIKQKGLPLDDDETIKKAYSYFTVEYDPQTRVLLTYERNDKKIEKARETSGFFANYTHGLSFTPVEANYHYHLRDEQEKYFYMMKGLMGSDRQRNWSESGKTGRLFILFVSQIIGCYLQYIRKSKMSDTFKSNADVLDEMRAIRYVEHPDTDAFITPFVGKQVSICEAFGFKIPEGCAPEYALRKTNQGKRGRPRKNKEVVKEESEAV